jgi:hypothetical protein
MKKLFTFLLIVISIVSFSYLIHSQSFRNGIDLLGRITAVIPDTGSQGLTFPITISGTGTNWSSSPYMLLYFDSVGVTTNTVVIVNDTTLTANLVISNIASLGYHKLTATDSVTLLTKDSAVFIRISAPKLSSPVNHSTAIAINPLFRWDTNYYANSYRLQIATDSLFTQIVTDTTGFTSIGFQLGNILEFNTKYYWRAKSFFPLGQSAWSEKWDFVTINPPAAPVLITPTNNSYVSNVTPTISWNSSSGALSYRLQVCLDSLFSTNIVYDTSGFTGTSIPVPSGRLLDNNKYYWRVNATNAQGTGYWSSIWSFTVKIPPSAPTLISPFNGATNVSLTPTLSWNSVYLNMAPATSYQVNISTDSLFSTVLYDTTITPTSFTLRTGVLSNITSYYWKIRGINQGGNGSWSLIWKFTTIVPIPSAPTLVSPANGTIDLPVTPALDWSDVTYATTYRVQVSMDSLFGTTSFDSSGVSASQINVPSGKLTTNKKYYWRVNANNVAGTGNWSLVWNFTTIPNVPNSPILSQPANGAINQPLTIIFKWFKSVEILFTLNKGKLFNEKEKIFEPLTISKYSFQYSTDSTFTSGVITDSTLTDTTKTLSGLPNATKYFWRVRAKNQTGWGTYSSVWNFTTIPPIPSAPVLTSPSNGSTGVSLTPALTWNTVTYAETYRVQVSIDSLFGTPLWDTTGVAITSATVPAGKLTGLTKYYWRVNATNVTGTSGWSTIWNFRTLQNLVLNLKFYLEGFWDGSTTVTDTARIYLALGSAPYTLSDSATVVFSSTGTSNPTFTKTINGNYYIAIKHRNHLETWSKLPQSFVTGTPVNYDFTTAANKAYGDNMKQVGSVWVFYGGDPNQDGSIDANDIPIFVSQFGQQGYLSCDFNGDQDVNAVDVQIISANFGLTKSVPALLDEGILNKKRTDDKLLKNVNK